MTSLLAACGSSVSDGDGEDGAGGGDTTSGTGGTGGEAACPEDFGGDCPYGAECVDGTWICNECSTGCETPGTCPASPPAPGGICSGFPPYSCSYESIGDCSNATATYTCSGGSWSEPSYSRCSQVLCRELVDAETCDASGCRWLEPGCGEEPLPLPAAGCFDLEPCTEGSCRMNDEICMPVSIEPACADEGCGACGEPADLCVPQLLGE